MAIPGTFIEIRVSIVKKDKSFRRPQRYCMKIERIKLRNRVPGKKADEINEVLLVILAEIAAVSI